MELLFWIMPEWNLQLRNYFRPIFQQIKHWNPKSIFRNVTVCNVSVIIFPALQYLTDALRAYSISTSSLISFQKTSMISRVINIKETVVLLSVNFAVLIEMMPIFTNKSQKFSHSFFFHSLLMVMMCSFQDVHWTTFSLSKIIGSPTCYRIKIS